MPALPVPLLTARRRLAALGVATTLAATASVVATPMTADAFPEESAPAATTAVGDQSGAQHSLEHQASLVAEFKAERARAKAAAAKARAKAKAERERKARAAARERAARSAVRDPKGVARALMADEYGWGTDQFSCLVSLWQRESNWNYRARNSSSGAYGIPQALPGAKMASAGADWQTNPRTQILWGLGYIEDRYGTPCSALGHSHSVGWY